MQVPSSIFREYDVRGIAGTEFSSNAVAEYEKLYGTFPGVTITPDIAQALGRAYGSLIIKRGGKKNISSPFAICS
jgi:phosphomannomutase